MKILIVDDEAVQLDILRDFLVNQGYEVITAENGRQALDVFKRKHIHLVLLDHRMPDINGDEVLEKMQVLNPSMHAIMITAYGAVDTAVKVMRLGADDFLEKPVDLSELLSKIQTIEQGVSVEKDVEQVRKTIQKEELPVNIIGSGGGMKEAISIARRVSATPWTVLIRGETGTGKELIARLIHELSNRKNAPFIEVNCAAIPENLFESELFGHKKGAFTGALSSRKGRFEQARGGTLFLDEVGELPMTLQPKLLRALQEKRITPVGADHEVYVDVRVVAATNRDLKKLAAEGHFREDLYYRLNVFEILISSLRHRKEDIPELIEFFVARYAVRPVKISDAALDILMKYPYPGNVRELKHVIQRIVTLARGNIIRPGDLPDEICKNTTELADVSMPLDQRLEALEQEHILSALEKNDWIQTRAADFLGISERVLRYKMKKYGISKRSCRPQSPS